MRDFRLDDGQRELQRGFHEFLAASHPPGHVRELWDDETGRSGELWAALAELGVLAVTIPESEGGLGLGEVELAALLEEAGYALLAEPLLATAAVAAPLLRELQAGKARLAAIAKGELAVAVSLEPGSLVADAHVASLLVLSDGDALYAVAPAEVGLVERPSVDRARRLFDVRWEPAHAEVLATGDDAARAAARAFDRGALATAAELLGVARRLVDAAVSHARGREQFGRPIGAFQAVKHMLADALLELEFARPAVYYAAALCASDPGGCSREVSVAKALASEAAQRAAHVALQVHGAVGYTEEHDVHFWVVHAHALSRAWRDAAWHRERIGRSLLPVS